MSTVSLVYVSYDRFPAAKGAAVHISQMIRGLSTWADEIDLVTVPGDTVGLAPTTAFPAPLPSNVRHHPLPALGANLIERTLGFRRQLADWFSTRSRAHAIHFRSIFEGYWLARHKSDLCDKLVFEVNGLPSIELKYRYPSVADDRELLAKLHHQEQVCLAAADRIITVSDVNARHLLERGVEPAKLRIIRNGVDTELFGFQRPRPWNDREINILYAGTMTAWQGIHYALQALALYRRDFPARMLLVGEVRRRQRKELEKECQRLNIESHVQFYGPASQAELAQLHHDSDAVLAPLTANDRNLVQGCCPLKVLEALASGTPLIASDLPVTRELAEHARHALLVRPGSAKSIKDGLLRLKLDPHLAAQMSAAGRRQMKSKFTWRQVHSQLTECYNELFANKTF